MHKQQLNICNKYGSKYLISPLDYMVGISDSVLAGLAGDGPVYGLRHPQENTTTGWYIYTGKYSDDPYFFKPLHAKHLVKYCPHIIKYLGLEPGWRFTVDSKGYEDVWFDKNLLGIN